MIDSTITHWLVAAAGAAVAALLFVRVKAVVREAARRVASRCALAAFAVFAAVCTAEAQKQKRGVDAPAGGVMAKRAAMPMRAAKVAAASGKSEPGARLAKATRMRSDSPRSDADRMASNWNLRGAQDDSFWLDFDDGFVFPFGDAAVLQGRDRAVVAPQAAIRSA